MSITILYLFYRYNNKYYFPTLSKQLSNTVYKDLNILAHEVLKISPVDFTITEGYRSKNRQEYLYKTGKSKTLNSKHTELKVNIRVGALWDNDSVKNNDFVDGWHIELK